MGSNVNLSFSGCGFLGTYHLGVATFFKELAPHLMNYTAGVSGGAVVASALMSDVPLDLLTVELFKFLFDARSRFLGPLSPSFDVQKTLFEICTKLLPPDAHTRLSGKLHISLTRLADRKNVVASQFECRDDLLDALACSFFVPLYSGFFPPKFHGIRYVDGGITDNLVTLNDDTITASVFCGKSDISPRDDHSAISYHINIKNTSIELSFPNLFRFTRTLLPLPANPLIELCYEGFNDSLDFVYKNKLMRCEEFLKTQKCKENCEKCHEANENLKKQQMPEYMRNVLETYRIVPNDNKLSSSKLTKLVKFPFKGVRCLFRKLKGSTNVANKITNL